MYTIEQVNPEEFRFLKAYEPHILFNAKSRFNGDSGDLSAQVQGIAVSLAYNPNDYLLGFILERTGQRHYIDGEVGLKPAEKALIGSLKSGIERILSNLRQVSSWFDENI